MRLILLSLPLLFLVGGCKKQIQPENPKIQTKQKASNLEDKIKSLEKKVKILENRPVTHSKNGYEPKIKSLEKKFTLLENKYQNFILEKEAELIQEQKKAISKLKKFRDKHHIDYDAKSLPQNNVFLVKVMNDKGINYGTAFALKIIDGKDEYIGFFTAQHTFANTTKSSLTIKLNNIKIPIKKEYFYFDKELDFAVIHSKTLFQEIKRQHKSIPKPNKKIYGKNISVFQVNKFARNFETLKNRGYIFSEESNMIYAPPIKAGTSGSPIFQRGTVVGMIVAELGDVELVGNDIGLYISIEKILEKFPLYKKCLHKVPN